MAYEPQPRAPEGDAGLERYIQMVESAEEASKDARAAAERDRDYYDNKQWAAEETEALKRRKQPILTKNRIKRKIDFLTGIEKQQRVDPKAYPRNPQDEASAEVATDALRYVEEKTNFDVTRSQVWEHMLIEGLSGAEVTVEYSQPAGGRMGTTAMTQPQAEIKIHFLPWDRLLIDPHSSRHDCQDARYVGVVIWMDLDDALAKYPDAKAALEVTLSGAETSDTYDDKPKHAVWADKGRKRVKIVQLYHREGGSWRWCLFTKGGKISSGEVPFTDEDGNSVCPIVLQSAYVDRENNRYGVVRELISPQDEINKRSSKALHLLNSRQVAATRGAVEDPRKAQAELGKPDGWIELAVGTNTPGGQHSFKSLETNDMAQGQMALLQESKAEIDMMGPNASMMGKGDKGAESGRAIQAQQQGGLVELATLLDRLRQWTLRVYRQVWCLVRQYWTTERWIRVTDDEEKMKFVGINQPTVDAMSQTVTVQNRVAEMDMDIIIEEAPDTITLQQEQFQILSDLAASGTVPIPPDVLIMASQLRNKERLLEKLKPQPGPPDPAEEIAKENALADIEKKHADINKTEAETARLLRPETAVAGSTSRIN